MLTEKRFPLLPLPCLSCGEPATAQLFGRDAGQVRFDVEDRSSIEHIDRANLEFGAGATKQFDDRDADGIWTAWRSRGEDAVRAVVGGWGAQQLEALGAVELPEDDEMREAFDVGEAWLELS